MVHITVPWYYHVIPSLYHSNSIQYGHGTMVDRTFFFYFLSLMPLRTFQLLEMEQIYKRHC